MKFEWQMYEQAVCLTLLFLSFGFFASQIEMSLEDLHSCCDPEVKIKARECIDTMTAGMFRKKNTL